MERVGIEPIWLANPPVIACSTYWGDRRDLNPHDWSHIPAPEPFGHGHTCWNTRADSNRRLSGTSRGQLRRGPRRQIFVAGVVGLCFECHKSLVSAGVNEQILRPLFYRHTYRSQQSARGVHGGGNDAVKQLHAGLFRRPGVLGLVALLAGGDQVLPGVAAAARTRKHVVERQLAGMKLPAAILAGVVITKIDVLLRNYLHAYRDVLILQQPDNTRLIDARINHALRRKNHRHLAFGQHLECLPYRNDPDGLEARVQ